MPTVTQHNPGRFCWVELATTDSQGATDFYSKILGWKKEDMPMGPDEVYSMMKLKDLTVAGMYKMKDEMKNQGIPPHWMCYVAVKNTDESAAKAKALGATILMEPFDVMEVGRMAVVRDPIGAVFALWQAGPNPSGMLVDEPGAMCWHELLTTDTAKASMFYQQLFGWVTKSDMPDYTEFLDGDRSFAGMMAIQKEWGPMPPNWNVYFNVENCDASVKAATDNGGMVMMGPSDIEKVGRFAVLRDPQGAVFNFIQLNQRM